MEPQDLWRWEGRLNRSQFFAIGFTAGILKIFLDWYVVSVVWHRPYGPFFYWRPGLVILNLHFYHGGDSFLAAVLALIAIPFLWLGVATTVKRLRDAGQHLWFACFFFVPVGNLLFFLILALLPTANGQRSDESAFSPTPLGSRSLIPSTLMGSALFTITLTTTLGLLFALLSTQKLATYGWGLFIGTPFCMGLFAVLLYSYHEPRTYPQCAMVSVLPIAIVGIILLAVAIEGLFCILMAAPICALLAWIGGSLGFAMQAARWTRRGAPFMMSIVVLVLPLSLTAEHDANLQPHLHQVTSSVVVNAPPEIVWQQVIAFSDIAPPKELLFRAGIAYPIHAEIAGSGPGAIRRCVFSTGPFVEPIEVWDEPHLLRFTVSENPAPMNELTPYGHIEPAHLHGYFVSRRGQFVLTELPGGKTRLEGTSWYTSAIWPEQYWHFWSDYIICRIHLRVLEHIRQEAELATKRE